MIILFVFNQKTAYEMRISGWSSDVCSSDLLETGGGRTWRCLVEAKIGKAEIEAEQVERYLTIARAHKVDAVLTISNQFVALPTHSQIGRASCRESVCQYV